MTNFYQSTAQLDKHALDEDHDKLGEPAENENRQDTGERNDKNGIYLILTVLCTGGQQCDDSPGLLLLQPPQINNPTSSSQIGLLRA